MASNLQDILDRIAGTGVIDANDFVDALKTEGLNVLPTGRGSAYGGRGYRGSRSGYNNMSFEQKRDALLREQSRESAALDAKGFFFPGREESLNNQFLIDDVNFASAERQEREDERDKAEQAFEKKKKEIIGSGKNSIKGIGAKNFDNVLSAYTAIQSEIADGKGQTDAEVAELVKTLKDLGFKGIGESMVKTMVAESAKLNDVVDVKLDLEEKTLDAIEAQTDELRKQNKLKDTAIRQTKQGLSDIKQGVSKVFNVAKDFLNIWGKIDQQASKFAKSVGVGAEGMAKMRRNAIETVAKGSFAAKYNVDASELIDLQNKFASSIGRNVMVSASDQENMAAINAVAPEVGADMATKLDNFGQSYTDVAKRAGRMFKEAGEYGISFEKYSKNFAENIKIAQNYTFANGLKGLEAMAKRATAIKLDMQQIASFAEKVSTVEGAVNTGAKLQVLGGQFAQFSNPLSMLNEGLLDVEGLEKRFERMIDGLARFNEKTGEVEISSFNKQRIKAAAEAMGMDYGQVIESAQAKGRRSFVENALEKSGRSWSDADAEFIKNTATIENGVAKLSYNDANGNKVERNISELSQNELELIRRQTQSESDDIKDIATTLRGWDDVITGGKKQYENAKARIVERKDRGERVKGKLTNIFENEKLMNISANVALWTNLISGTWITLRGIKKSVDGIRMYLMTRGAGSGQSGSGSNGNNGGGILNGIKNKWGNWSNNYNQKMTSLQGKGGLKKFAGNVGSKLGLGGSIAVGAAGVIGGQVLAGYGRKKRNELNDARKSGTIERGSAEDRKKNTGSKIMEFGGHGASVGALIGSFMGGPVGTAIGTAIGASVGALIGTGVGWAQNANNKKARARKQSLNASGLAKLTGDYRNKDLKAITEALYKGGDHTITKEEFEQLPKKAREELIRSGDAALFPELSDIVATAQNANVNAQNSDISINNANISVEKKTRGKDNPTIESKATGGLLNGPSHANGGMPIKGTNIEVEGGEFVVNKKSTEKYLTLLNHINSMGNGGQITLPMSTSNNKHSIVNTNSLMSNGGVINKKTVNTSNMGMSNNVSMLTTLNGINNTMMLLKGGVINSSRFNRYGDRRTNSSNSSIKSKNVTLYADGGVINAPKFGDTLFNKKVNTNITKYGDGGVVSSSKYDNVLSNEKTNTNITKYGDGGVINAPKFGDTLFNKKVNTNVTKYGDGGIINSPKFGGALTSNVSLLRNNTIASFANGGIINTKKSQTNFGGKSVTLYANGGMLSNMSIDKSIKNSLIDSAKAKMGNGGVMPSPQNEVIVLKGSDVITPKPIEMTNNIVKENVMKSSPVSESVGQQIKIDPINININGSIKLEGLGHQSVDISDKLLNSPEFIREITKMIEKQVRINTTGGNTAKRIGY